MYLFLLIHFRESLTFFTQHVNASKVILNVEVKNHLVSVFFV